MGRADSAHDLDAERDGDREGRRRGRVVGPPVGSGRGATGAVPRRARTVGHVRGRRRAPRGPGLGGPLGPARLRTLGPARRAVDERAGRRRSRRRTGALRPRAHDTARTLLGCATGPELRAGPSGAGPCPRLRERHGNRPGRRLARRLPAQLPCPTGRVARTPRPLERVDGPSAAPVRRGGARECRTPVVGRIRGAGAGVGACEAHGRSLVRRQLRLQPGLQRRAEADLGHTRPVRPLPGARPPRGHRRRGGRHPPRTAVDSLERALPRVRRVVLPEAGHIPWVEDPEGFRQAVATVW